MAATSAPVFLRLPAKKSSLPLLIDDRPDDVVQSKPRRNRDHRTYLVQPRDAAGHVVEALAVGMLVGDMLDRTARAAEGNHAAGQVVDRDFLVAAEVENLADRRGTIAKSCDG